MDNVKLVYWHWWALGSLFLIVELLAPGMFFLWLASAAFVTGTLLWGYPNLSLEVQFIAFAVLAVVSVLAMRRYLIGHPIVSDKPSLNRRTAQYVGRVYAVEQAIVNGEGRVRLDDTVWKVRGKDCPVGTFVRVESADGVVLHVVVVGEDAQE
jgi:membrane protein implicated in regulation of membrane protease activity